ncbi:substrate-binding domain-containing protein [soil metagenome]
MAPPKPNMHDVARLAGVSVASVSNYFHRPDKISDATRERIREAMDTSGFVPNAAARTLRTGINLVVGYLAFELASATTSDIAVSIERRVADRGMHLLMANDVGSRDRELSYLRLFEQQRVAGVIVAPLGDVEPELAQMRARGVASVLSARRARSDSQASVYIDHVWGGAVAVRHLVEIGRRRIGFVTSPRGLRQVDDRYAGARSVVDTTDDVEFEVLEVPERTVAEGAACAAALMRRPVDQRPDALFCINDLVAIGVMQGLLGAGARIPEDCAVVGYDDIDFAASARVPLTTIRTPHQGLGEAAADLLFAEIDRLASGTARGDDKAPHVEFTPELIVRDSTVGP